jgi:hypothetical protein
MNSKIRNLLLSSILVILAGCSVSAGQVPAAPASTKNTSTSNTSTSGLSLTMKTGLGILELEGDALAVDAIQAKELLPLWQALQNLSSDSNTTPEEIASLNDQIKETLSADQLKAIDKMSWDEQELSALTKKYALAAETTSGQNDQRSQKSSSSGAMIGGGMPGGDGAPPQDAGGAVLMTGANTSTSATTTSHAAIPGQTERVSAGGMNLKVAPAVIQLLQAKIASA